MADPVQHPGPPPPPESRRTPDGKAMFDEWLAQLQAWKLATGN